MAALNDYFTTTFMVLSCHKQNGCSVLQSSQKWDYFVTITVQFHSISHDFKVSGKMKKIPRIQWIHGISWSC